MRSAKPTTRVCATSGNRGSKKQNRRSRLFPTTSYGTSSANSNRTKPGGSPRSFRSSTLFSVVHTLESPSQIREIAKAEATIDGLIEINIADEPQKSGIRLAALDEFVQECLHCDRVRLRGLMTIGPQVQNAEDMRPYFRKLRERLSEVPKGTWLSMGMSSDSDVAIQEGATHIRVGTALFGVR